MIKKQIMPNIDTGGDQPEVIRENLVDKTPSDEKCLYSCFFLL